MLAILHTLHCSIPTLYQTTVTVTASFSLRFTALLLAAEHFQVWNCLPPEVTSAPPLATFRTRHQTSVYWVILWHSTYVTFTLHTVYSAPIVVFLILRLFDWLIDWLIMFPFTDPGIFERPRVVPPLPFLSPSPLPYSFTSPFALRSRTP